MDVSEVPSEAEWLRSPSGGLLHLPSIRARLAKGCGDCGRTDWIIVEGAIRCPDCARTRTRTPPRVLGRFDLVECRIVNVCPPAVGVPGTGPV